MIKVEGHSNLFRDSETGAIINKDNHGYDQYLKLIKSDNKKERELTWQYSTTSKRDLKFRKMGCQSI